MSKIHNQTTPITKQDFFQKYKIYEAQDDASCKEVHKRNPQGHKGMAETENQKKKMPRYNVYIDKIKAIRKNQVLSSG